MWKSCSILIKNSKNIADGVLDNSNNCFGKLSGLMLISTNMYPKENPTMHKIRLRMLKSLNLFIKRI